MKKLKLLLALMGLVLLATLAACSDDLSTETGATEEEIPENVDDATTSNAGDHESDDDYVWDASTVTTLVLNGTSITVNGTGATASGSKVTITSAGNYSISGALTNGQVVVDTDDAETVRLILNGVNIANASSSPIYVLDAKKVIVVLTEATENFLTDAASYTFATGEDEPNAALFSTANLTVFGTGSLAIDANYNDGIASKDGLIIKSGTINIDAKDDGIRGKDYLIVRDGQLTVTSGGDGLKSDNEEDATLGYILVDKGSFDLTTAGDGLDAVTDVLISDGEFTIISGGGSSATMTTSSAKGIKGAVDVVIDAGEFSINSADDALHANNSVSVNGGTFSIATKDDAIHADNQLLVHGGTINITKSYEGLESAAITIAAGEIHLIASDDGINGSDGTTTSGGPGGGSSGSAKLTITGGYTYVNATGDGVDVNGSIAMTDGVLIVNGPTANNNAPLDYDGTFVISGGFVLATGSSGMAQIPGSSSTQNSVLLKFSSAQAAGQLVHLQSSEGTELFTFKPAKNYQSIAFSAPSLTKQSYDLYVAGSDNNAATDGLYAIGGYQVGTKKTTFSVSGVSTQVTVQ